MSDVFKCGDFNMMAIPLYYRALRLEWFRTTNVKNLTDAFSKVIYDHEHDDKF